MPVINKVLIANQGEIALQINVAEGEPLPFEQNDLQINAQAIECRIYAEDPRNQFLPSTGTLRKHRIPAGIGVRVDAGVEKGAEGDD